MSAADAKYEIHVEGKDIPADEPLFLIRGQDRLAPAIVAAYGDELEARGGEELHVLAVREFELRLRRWQLENPDRVKDPD